MLCKKLLLPVIAVLCFVTANTQRIKLEPLYAANKITPADNKIKTAIKPTQLKPIGKDYILANKISRIIKPSCIPRNDFTFLQFQAARQDDKTVKLVFETVNEYTSRSFIIERVYAQGTEEKDITQPADTCYQLFVKAHKVDRFSNTDSTYAKNRQEHKCTYKLTDNNIYSGITFYRITETGIDNSTVSTQIIAVPGRPVKEIVSVYPNPVVNSATLKVYSKYAGNSTVQLITANGNVIKQFNSGLQKGMNNLVLNVPGVASGMYLVRVLRQSQPALQTNLVKQ